MPNVQATNLAKYAEATHLANLQPPDSSYGTPSLFNAALYVRRQELRSGTAHCGSEVQKRSVTKRTGERTEQEREQNRIERERNRRENRTGEGTKSKREQDRTLLPITAKTSKGVHAR